jgi:aspartyl-tRNA synthetase
MNKYRDYYLKDINTSLVGKNITVSGWVNRSRDHGNLLFIDLRDSTSLLQCVVDNSSTIFANLSKVKNEDVLQISGLITKRSEDTINTNLESGEVELQIEDFYVLSSCSKNLPLEVNSDNDYGEEIRLKYRYLDLRRSKMQKNIKLRHDVINHVRGFMNNEGFMELATPILTAPSPEGARDYLVPSRIHKGSFYALPQAPQQFKQLYIASGIDKYFQIAPCFRDEDSRADRSPGEFYQIDMEMSFATQEDVLDIISRLLFNIFDNFKAQGKSVNSLPFPLLSYKKSIQDFGCDKPDLRNPLRLLNVTNFFKGSGLQIFENLINKGAIVNCIQAINSEGRARSFYDNLNKWAQEQGKKGLGHRPDIMKKAFEIAGYNEETIKSKFSALFEAFHYGVPPHGGCAPGLDRIIMLLSDNENIREVIAFPFNQRAQDLMMNAPVQIDDKQLKELNIKKI